MAVVGGALLGLISTGGGAYLFGATLWASVLTGASLGYAFSTQDVPGASSPTYSFGEISNTKTQLLPVPIVYGHCRVAGNVFYCRYYDDQKQKADQYIGISEGPIQGITEVMAGDQLIEDLSECSLDIYLNSDSSTSDKRDPKGDVQRPYPNDFAFIATTLKAQEKYRGNEPITSIVDGRIVWTPTGLRWTSNPAWIIRDFITDKRYGFGIPPSAIDEISFAEAAAYCDGVPLGSVGPRFTLNGVIDTKKKGVDHLKEMLSCFRGFIIAREKVALRVEAPVLNYDRKIGFDEIVTGTFSWWESGNDEILNRVIIQWTDPENAWEQTTTIFENTADIIKRGIIDKTFSLNWITSADQASRMGAFLLDCSNAVTNFCSFGLTLSCADVELGDVIALTNDLPGWEDKWMRVISIDDGENDSITVTCSEYVAEVYNDRAMDFPIHVDTNLPNPWTCPDVIGLTGAERVTVDTDGTVLSDIDLFWTDPDVLLRSVEVLVLEAGSVTWKSCGTVLPGVGNYVVRGLASNQVVSVLVRPVNTAGIKAGGKTVTLTLHGKAYPPAEPTELTAVGGFQVVEISWRNPGDADLKHIEVWESKDDVQANAYKAADVDGTSLTRSNLSNLTTFWYWIRAVDTSGNVSGWVGPVSATTETIKAPDIPEGLIDPPMLSDVLREPIERIPDIEVDIEGINVEVGNIRDITIPSIDAEIKEIQDITIPSIDAEIKEIQDITIPSIDAEIKEIQDITIPEVNINIRDSIQRLSERVSELDEGYVEQLRQAGSGAIRTLLQLRGINKKLTDAGIVVDPSTGQVRIWAVDQLRNEYNIRLSEAEITVDALASSIKSKASLAEVDARIAEAVFGDVGELLVSGLQARIVTVEENLNAVEGTLTEKASAVDVNEIGGRVTVAESRLDGLDAEIALTASTEEVGQLNSRVTSAETKIDGFQGAVTTQVVALSKDGRDLSGLTAEGVIRNVLNANNDRKAKNIQLALAKESLKAYTDQGLAAEAQQRLDLAAIVGVNHAELIEEKTVRSSQNEAVVQSIEILSAKTDQNDARITSETTARTDGDSALSGRLDTVQAKVEGNTAAIQTEANARADETSALGSRLDTVQAKTNANEAAIQTEAQTRANETGANAQAISTVAANLGKEETERKAAIQQVSTAIVDGDSALSSRIDTVQAKANNNTAAIQTEAQTRANETGALAEEINTLQTRTGNNESAIQEEREVRSNETSAIGSTVSTLVSESDANLGESVIKGILQLAKARALIKTERATNTSEREALASLITTLQAELGNTQAVIQEEQTVRATETGANAQAIQTVSASLDGEISNRQAAVQQVSSAMVEGDQALSSRIDTVQAKAEGNTAAIQTEANARADETSALGSRLDTVQAKTNANEAAIQTEAQTRANETGANAQAISTVAANLGKEETERKAAIQQVSTAIVDGDSALSSRIDTVQAKANNNTAAIQTEAQTRANETGALAEEINTLQTRTGNNESAIQEEREVRSNETSAIGSTVSTLVSESDANLGESVIKGILQLAKARALIKTERATNTSEREALASLITTLQAELGNTQAVIQEEQTVRATETGANASAIRTVAAKLDDEVGNRQAAVKSEADARVDALGAIGERIDAVQTKANNNESAIQTEAQARSNETGAMGSLMTTVVASSDKSLAEATVKDLLNRHSDKKRSNRQLAVIQQNLKAEIEEGISSEAAKRETLASQIDGSLAAVDTQLNTLATQDKAMAEAISTVQATANGNTSSVKTVAEAVADVDGLLKAQYVIKVDANGKVAGIGLVANGEVSEFAINADRLLLIDPNGGSDIPPFVVGVDPETGKAALYLNGDLFAAGTIKGEHINASSTISLAGGAILLDGINGVVRISDPNDLVHGDYLTITNGYLRQYMWIDGAYRLRRALTTRETGVAENNTWCMLKERYNNAPDIHISPYNLSCYNPAYQAQPQNLVLKVKEVANIAPGQWRFLPEATLAVGTESGSTPPPVVPEGLPGSYVQSNDYGYEERKTTESYSHSTTLPPNLQSLTVRVKLEPKSFWCNKDSDGGGTYYKGGYGTAFLQIRQVGGSWSDVASSSVRIRTEGYAQTVALSWSGFLVGVNYEMRVLAKSYYYPDCYPSDDIHVWWNGMQYHIFNRADRYPFEILSAEVTFRAGTVLATGTVNYIAVGE